MAWAPPPYTEDRKWAVYAASKTESEKACFKFAEELDAEMDSKAGEGESKGRRIVVNSVVPSVNFGPPLHESQSAETLVWIRRLIEGDMGVVKDAGPPRQYLFFHHLTYLSLHLCSLTYRALIFNNLIQTEWFVDVRDTARLHVAAFTNPTITSERLFAQSETYNWTRVLSILRRTYPSHQWPQDPENESEDLSTFDEPRKRSLELLREMGRDGFISLEESVKINAEMILKRR